MFTLYANSLSQQFGDVLNDLIKNNVATIVLVLTSIVIITAFLLLLGRKEDKLSLFAAFGLIILASILTTTVSPLKEWNTLVIAALLTPIFAYFIDILKEKQKLSSERDRLVWEYKCQQLQKESDVISELLGELSIHAAAFKSSYAQKIETQRWKNSFKASVISELHTLSIARYYNYIPKYNNLVLEYNRLIEKKATEDLDNLSDNFQELKDAFLGAEILVFLTLTYDLGYLQQNYLVRPTDEFPMHVNLMFTRHLEKLGIIKKGEKIVAKKVFSERGSKRFNKKTVIELNDCFHRINLQLRLMRGELEKLAE